MDEARRRMQEQFDAQAARHAEEMKKVYSVKINLLLFSIMCMLSLCFDTVRASGPSKTLSAPMISKDFLM